MSSIAASYDEIPYESSACLWSHPERLATLAKLYGLDAPPIDRCRILELGCANGANLIPLACAFTDARIVGIDLSPRQIADGQTLATALNLSNIELRCASILDLGPSLGTFDYILCHGVYSWAPAVVQERILEICARHLAPNGLAYIDYNTLPGWQGGRLLREIAYFHSRRFPDSQKRLAEVRRFLDFLARSVSPQEHDAYASLLRTGALHFQQGSDSYLLHEYLDEAHESLYFHEFAQRAAGKQLQHLADARFPTLLGPQLGPEVDIWLEQSSADPTEREQYIDLVANRAFRRSVLCHARQALAPTRYPQALTALHVASSARPQSPEPDLVSTAAESFHGVGGVKLVVLEPPLKTALFLLSRVWPNSLPFDALDRQTSARLGLTAPQDLAAVRQTLTMNLLTAFLGHQGVEFHVHPPRCAPATTPRPAVSSLVAWQAAHGFRVTSLRHQTFEVSEGERQFLRRLDGSLERGALVELMKELMARDLLKPLSRGTDRAEPLTPSPIELLEHYLAQFASWSLFRSPHDMGT